MEQVKTQMMEHRLSSRVSDGKQVSSYEVLNKLKTVEWYKVLVRFDDGQETVEEGGLEFFNSAYNIVTINTWL